MKEIDWSKAPEGATHYHYDCCFPWLRDGERPAYFRNGKWVEYTNPDTGRAHINDEVYSVPRPAAAPAVPAWTGAGLPPVGTVCEMWHEKIGDWLKSEVAFVGEQILVVRYHSIAHGHHEAAIMNVDSEKLLRLPRTPEQIAAEERKRAISEMLRIYTDGAAGHCGGIAALYDAGYRRQEPKE